LIIQEEDAPDDFLAHYGILRRSGRYPWGSSGNTVEQRSRDFLGAVEELRKKGLTDTQIAAAFSTEEHPFTTTMLRATNTIARNAVKQADINMAQRLKDKGYSNVAIGERMGINESSVRALLAPGAKDKAENIQTIADMLKDEVEAGGYIQVGSGVERHLGTSRTKMDIALSMLKSEDYEVINIQVDQLGTGNKTLVKVLAPKGTTYKDVVTAQDKIRNINMISDDGGRTFEKVGPPKILDSKRVGVLYDEDGGTAADGVIYVRPGKEDLSLGGARYAQVRIAVDGTHYIKGMAIYKDDLPDGIDVMVNTNKKKGTPLLGPKDHSVLKLMKDDPEDPWGSITKPVKGSVMNKLNEEGDWDNWSKNLASQMLSKQHPSLAKQQLDLTHAIKAEQFEEIMSLTNPAVKRKLLQSYADDVDSSAVHLKAAALPRQRTQVIIPANSLKDTEIYAPNFRDGERVALVRYPHGGTFEIPELTVNNKNPGARKLLGNAMDAVGINAKVAERLSGADFDGDTVLVIPNNKRQVKSTPALEGLKDFDPKREYPPYPGMKRMTARQKQQEMGNVSNLITDMTIKGAEPNEIARAVRHSMVVIDAEKHNLDFRASAQANGIHALKKKYQGDPNNPRKSGASTLISQTTSEARVTKRKRNYRIDPETGKKVWIETPESYVDKRTGKTVVKKIKSTKGYETDDAHTLSSGTPIEKIYADHSNRLKSLANRARKELVSTKTTPYSPSARRAYSKEVVSLDAKLNIALRNAPLERQAQLIANTIVSAKRQSNPDMENDELKKVKSKALIEARTRVGAKKTQVQISEREWEAIQAGAISNEKLSKIMDNTDLDELKKLATPRANTVMTSAKQAKADALLAAGYTQSEVADAIGVALSTLKSSIGR
jgi:hypothetical protein